MIIKEIYIENFGKLSGFKQRFSGGLNIIAKENGYGKTTIAAFIKSMLYGIESNRKHSLLDNPRKRYTPWQGGYFGGSLIYEAGGVEYKVERSFGSKASLDTFVLTDLKTGKELPSPTVSLGEHLFDIDEEGFEKTVFLSETNIYMDGAPDSVSARLAGISGIEGDVNGFDEAIELLDKQRKNLYKKGGSGMIKDAENEASLKQERLDEITAAEKRISELDGDILAIDKELFALKKEKDALLEKRRISGEARLRSGLAEEYSAKKARLQSEKLRGEELMRFFSGGIPDVAEISKHETALATAANIRMNLKNAASYETISPPFRNIPDEEKIAELSLIASGAGRGNKGSNYISIIALMLTLISFGIGFIIPLAFIATGIFLALAIATFFLGKKTKGGNDEVKEYINNIYGEEKSGEALQILVTMRSELELYNRELKRIQNQKDFAEQHNAAELAHANSLEEQAKKFLSLFPTVSEQPFEEIRKKLYDFAATRESINLLGAECEEFERLHSGENLTSFTKPVIDRDLIETSIGSAEKRISELEQKRILADNDRRNLMRLAAGKIHAESELADSLTRAENYRKSLSVITKTQDLLAKAKTNMTARYLDKTRTKFTEYTSYVSKDAGEFTIDTDFEIKRNDLGAMRHSASYSRGQRELYQLSLRLALISSIYDKEKPPIILDDPFISFDDAGAANGIELLRKLGAQSQIIYFTCSKARA